MEKTEQRNSKSSLCTITPNNPAGLPKGISNVDSWCPAASLNSQDWKLDLGKIDYCGSRGINLKTQHSGGFLSHK